MAEHRDLETVAMREQAGLRHVDNLVRKEVAKGTKALAEGEMTALGSVKAAVDAVMNKTLSTMSTVDSQKAGLGSPMSGCQVDSFESE